MKSYFQGIILLFCLTFVSSFTYASGGISFSYTRIIFDEDKGAASLIIRNHGDGVYLINSGIAGDQELKSNAPFTVIPPIFRLDANSNNTIRIIKSKSESTLPIDRESIFYFHSTAIPGSSTKESDNNIEDTGAQLSIAMRTILKVIYRPARLKGKVEDTYGLLTFKNDNGFLKINNPTPYYQTLALLNIDGVPVDLNQYISMVDPVGNIKIPVKKSAKKVEWKMITDVGGESKSFFQTIN
ncbi:molecular chaperone [Providencia sneebia]|uniref:Fimbrial chaperone n=1 Tax=Providencia sneebia DSM 19967 TaxID=1141660 RepID=K8WK38_9GAMM|nr:hypothetical protein OO7_02761 [Providencia sneebia DSM 19967]